MSEDYMRILRETEALLDGHFELRSGLHSDRYFQCANVLRYPGRAGELCAELTDKLRRECPAVEDVDGVIAPAMGGIIVGYEVVGRLGVKSIFVGRSRRVTH